MKYVTIAAKAILMEEKIVKHAKKRYNEYVQKYRQEAHKNNMCYNCYRNEASPGYGRCEQCKNRLNKYVSLRRKYNKDKVFNFYGGYKCVCCSETLPEFLTVDHINNDGSQLKINGRRLTGHQLYEWIIKNKYPTGFQILCWNCNSGKTNGICPHKLQKVPLQPFTFIG